MARNTSRRDRHRAFIAKAQPACHLCGRSIDYELRYDDPMSFVIDHVKPLAKGGSDTIDNIAAAHRSCNSTKRARIISPVIKRSGSLD